MDGLWKGLEKAGLRADRLFLEWCSAAEGGRWQTIMQETEKKRQSVTSEEVEKTRSILADMKVPSPQNPKASDDNQDANFACMRCGHHWTGVCGRNTERICMECRSNSVRWIKDKAEYS
jgi:hypothetical protein